MKVRGFLAEFITRGIWRNGVLMVSYRISGEALDIRSGEMKEGLVEEQLQKLFRRGRSL
jgi:hypothetical protein